MKFLLAILLLFCTAAHAERPVYTIYTATTKGTYYQFALDIQRACPALDVQVEPTDGSLDNINRLIQVPYTRTGNRFAFVQQDALTSVLGSEPRARGLIKHVMTMHDEDISILVNKGSHIKKLRDLDGKRVAAGVAGSGTRFSAASIKNRLGLNWTAVDRTLEESVLGVLMGDIDAVFLVAGQPLRIYSELGKAMSDRIELVPMPDPALNTLYPTKVLSAGTYPWQTTEILLRSTKSIMVTAADVKQPAIKELLNCMSGSQSELRRWGHPQWKSIFPIKKK